MEVEATEEGEAPPPPPPPPPPLLTFTNPLELTEDGVVSDTMTLISPGALENALGGHLEEYETDTSNLSSSPEQEVEGCVPSCSDINTPSLSRSGSKLSRSHSRSRSRSSPMRGRSVFELVYDDKCKEDTNVVDAHGGSSFLHVNPQGGHCFYCKQHYQYWYGLNGRRWYQVVPKNCRKAVFLCKREKTASPRRDPGSGSRTSALSWYEKIHRVWTKLCSIAVSQCRVNLGVGAAVGYKRCR